MNQLPRIRLATVKVVTLEVSKDFLVRTQHMKLPTFPTQHVDKITFKNCFKL